MHRLIESAKDEIRTWSSDQPRGLSLAVASLCCRVLDDGDLPEGDIDWRNLRQALAVIPGESITSTIAHWDDLCRLGDFDISDHDAFVKLGIVTWTVRMLLKKLGMLAGATKPMELEEWKVRLINCLDRYILVG